MKVALMHFRAGETDGVSLEMNKWKKAMLQLGKECVMIAGCGGDYNHEYLDFRTEVIKHFFTNAFDNLIMDEESLHKLEQKIYKVIYSFLEKVFLEVNPDVLIVNNVFSLPLNIPLAQSIVDLAQKHNIQIIGFHHDFYWEREIYNVTCPRITKQLEKYFPPQCVEKHLVINSIAQKSLKNQKNIASTVVDNYFDFEEVTFGKDAYNAKLRKTLNITPKDIFVLHATRIVKRKGIEFALQMCAAIKKKIANDKRKIYLVFPGLQEDTPYFEHLKKCAKYYDIDTLFVPDLCTHERKLNTFSLWDFYVEADLVTYTSLYEGWGNQLVEAIAAKKPIVIYEYPVFKSNIQQLGFELFSLGDEHKEKEGIKYIEESKVDKVAKDVLEFLKSPQEDILEKNYLIAEKYLSIDALKEVCAKL